MKPLEKQKLYDAFLQEWGFRLEKIPSILDYISWYKGLFPRQQAVNLIGLNEIYESQLEWVALVAQFTNPVETSFFRNYWVPVQNDDYDFFIDLSTDAFTLFEAQYFQGEPYCWYKKFIINDLTALLLHIDQPEFNLEKYKEKNDADCQAHFDKLLEQNEARSSQ